MSALRVLFVNTGILGHRSVARLVREAIAADAGIEAVHVDLSAELTAGERVARRLLAMGPRPGTAAGALTAARFRHELDAGVRAARRIAALEAKMGRFDVLHFHPQPAAWASLRRMRRTPSVVSIDITQRLASLEAPPGVVRRDYRLPAGRDRRVFRAAAAIISTSRWAADDLAAEQPECARKVRVMPYPVPLDGFGAEWAEERRAKSGDELVRVLFVGGDFARKGGAELLEAWRAGGFAERARLTLVTDAPLDALPPGVDAVRGIRAYTPAWFALWRAADVFAMPTRGEAFGMVYQEAAAAGIPAIGTAINAIPEIVVDGETGILVPPGDGDALVAALRRLIESPEQRWAMGTAARRRIEETGSTSIYGKQLGMVIREAAAGGARG
ncbi:glycosyltransferase family 4 protein [Longimicrobium sp.]|uniref:glycosyltransferase family 4 protein n=1 Tax=Longimicrobium sp. TaxID=2029185 RepID=UPI002CAE5AAA|nr:glycosyltransferase family 4 protein [Longimicrobium sp.]HSU15214.1 glycosyltransferase family 4 protein [Longimicrobium sp.]